MYDNGVLRQRAMSDGVTQEEFDRVMASTAAAINRPTGIISVAANDPDYDLETEMHQAFNHGPGSILIVRRKPFVGWIKIEEDCRTPEPGTSYLCCTVNRKVMVTARPLDDWLIRKYSLTHWAEIVLPETLSV